MSLSILWDEVRELEMKRLRFSAAGAVREGCGDPTADGIGRCVVVKFVAAILIQALVIALCFQIQLGYYGRPAGSSGWTALRTTCPGVAGECLLLRAGEDDFEDSRTIVVPGCATGDPVFADSYDGVRRLGEKGSGRYVRVSFPGCPSDEAFLVPVTD